MALPTRGTRPPTTAQALVTPTRKTTQAPGPTSPTREQTPETRGTTTLQPVERRHKPSKLDKMRRQKNKLQMKEQGKNPQDQINEEEIGNLPEKEFRVMIVKMMQDIRNRIQA